MQRKKLFQCHKNISKDTNNKRTRRRRKKTPQVFLPAKMRTTTTTKTFPTRHVFSQPTRVPCTIEVQQRCTHCTWIFARLAPNRTLSRHLLTIIMNIVLCYLQLCVHFGIESCAQLALFNKLGTLLPLRSSVGNLLRVYC